jgi:hypothetical protein
MVLLKNKILFLGFLIIIIVLAGGGYILWQKNIKDEPTLTETTQQQQEAQQKNVEDKQVLIETTQQQKVEQKNNSQSIFTVPDTSASAITSPPPSMVGINTHTELYGTGADPDIITLGPKVGGHPGWTSYEHKPGMSFEAYKDGSPVLAPFDMVLVGFRDTSTEIVSGESSTHSDDIKLFF